MKHRDSIQTVQTIKATEQAPPLIQAMKDYDGLQRKRFHVPTHAGSNILPKDWDLVCDPYRYDLTEVEGLDVLSEPSECLADAQRRVADIFQVSHSFFLVNGASVGLMATMLSILKPGDKVLLPRNVHRSVLSGLILIGAEPVWMLPERLPEWGLWGCLQSEEVEKILQKHADIKALFITSPTYEGIGSDVSALSKICRQAGIYFVVDEAHGSLWPFSNALPTSACHLDCDAVIHSMHKTGGSLTQSALAHLPKTSRIDASIFQQALNTLQTTSPSYLLLASLEAACHALIHSDGQTKVQQLFNRTQQLRKTLHQHFKHYQLFEPTDSIWDPCKLYLVNSTVSGEDWAPRIEADERIAYESASPYGALYLAGLGLETDDFEFFQHVFLNEDQHAFSANHRTESLYKKLEEQNPTVLLPEMAITPREAFFAAGEKIESRQAVGRIAKETVVHCPPGIPVILPGERITASHLPYLPEQLSVVL
jgi:arginine/lysine/ornithine decarboxylase